MSAASRAHQESVERDERVRDAAEDTLEMLKDCACYVLSAHGSNAFYRSISKHINWLEGTDDE